MGPPLPIVEPGRAKRGPSTRPAIMEAAHCLGSLALAAWLLVTQPGRWLRLRAALRRLGASLAAHAGELTRPQLIERLLARRAAAERALAATAPPWPDAELSLRDRTPGLLRGGLLRWAGPRQLARRRLRAVERQLGAAAMGLSGLPGPVLAELQHASVVEEALVAAGDDIGDLLGEAAASGRAMASAAADGLRTGSAVTAHAVVLASLATGRATRAGSLAVGRATRAGSLAAGRATRAGSLAAGSAAWAASRATGRAAGAASHATGRATWAGLLAVGRGIRATVLALRLALLATASGVVRAARAAGRPLCLIVRAMAAPPDRRLPAWRRFLRPVAAALTLTLIAAVLAGVPAAAMLGGSVKAASAGLPDLAKLRPLSQPERSQVYDRNGRLIEVLHDEQDRIVVPLASIPQVLRNAVLAAEDERFYQHHGIDDRGILRALLANLLQRQPVQGGSTITQQLVRNAYPDLRDRSLVRKVKEASLAAQLEERMSKDEILAAYLNRVYFGAGYYGVEAASRGYFGKHASDLSLAQAATLAGVIREPEGANPRDHPGRALERRNTVLQQMVLLNMVSAEAGAKAADSRLRVQPPDESGTRYPWFIDALKRQLMADPRLGSTEAERRRNLYEGGLQIITTLDRTVQQQAEHAAATWRPKTGPDVALVSLDPRDGAVRAMVGGRNFSRHKFNLAVQAQRQPGSSFKPFVLAAAMANGISPDSQWESSGFSSRDVCGVPWTVENFEGHGSGRMSLRDATWHSVNGVYARVMARLCPAKVVSMARRLGLYVPPSQSHAPSIALGSANVTPLDMASAYATIANLGVYEKPMLFTKISRHGRTLIDNRPRGERRISAALAFAVTDVLKGVIRSGTGTAAQIGRPEAGKTGTTQDFRDAWFIGYTPQLSTAVWMGNPGQEIPMEDVGGIQVTGGSYPARIWHDFMAAALAGQPSLDWSRPQGSLRFSVGPSSTATSGDRRRSHKRRHGRG
jgi:1A family penicillin-binding protein